MDGRAALRSAWLLGALILAASAAGAQPAPVPPPPGDGSVNCASPVYAVDSAVCGDAELRRKDSRIATMEREWDARRPAGASLIETRSAWSRRRAMCVFNRDRLQCLRDASDERLTVLEAARSADWRRAVTMWCSSVGWPNPTRVLADARRVVLFDGANAVQGVAVAPPRSSWRPFLAIDRQNRDSITLRRDRTTIRCERDTRRPPDRPRPPA